MEALAARPALVEQVHDAIPGEIAAGAFAPGDRIIREPIAQAQGVSRQPVLQARMLRRILGEVPMRDETPRDIRDRHEALLKAGTDGDADRAETLLRAHLTLAPGFMVARLRAMKPAAPA